MLPRLPVGAVDTHVLIPDTFPYEKTVFHVPVLLLYVFDEPTIDGSSTTVTTESLAQTDTATAGTANIIIIVKIIMRFIFVPFVLLFPFLACTT